MTDWQCVVEPWETTVFMFLGMLVGMLFTKGVYDIEARKKRWRKNERQR